MAVFIIFAVFAFLSLVFWVLNWFCWRRKLCCFKVFDEYSDKVFVWWLSWVFFCGILACIIAGFVSANRLGFALNGIQCAYERIYYDSINGQMKDSYPKWMGFKNANDTINLFKNILGKLVGRDLQSLTNNFYYSKEQIEKETNITNITNISFIYPVEKNFVQKIIEIERSQKDDIEKIKEGLNEINRIMFSTIINYIQFITNSYIISSNTKFSEKISEIEFIFKFESELKEYKSKFMPDLKYLINVGKGVFKILPIIYFSILLIFVVGSGALLITYFCKKVNQQWWILPMHIAWNGVRFFIFSFFMYGFAYGALDYLSRDLIALLQYTFSRENLENGPSIIPEKTQNFFKYCLLSQPNITELFSKYDNTLVEFLKNAAALYKFKANNPQYSSEISKVNDAFSSLVKTVNGLIESEITFYSGNLTSLVNIINRDGNIYESLDCGFLNITLNVMYRAVWDFSWESRNLCALSCCIAFFGIIAVYSFLWVMELWKREGGEIPSKNKYNDYSKFKDTNKKKKRAGIKPPQDYNNDNDNEDGSGSELQQY